VCVCVRVCAALAVGTHTFASFGMCNDLSLLHFDYRVAKMHKMP